jgi:hypothetical protein
MFKYKPKTKPAMWRSVHPVTVVAKPAKKTKPAMWRSASPIVESKYKVRCRIRPVSKTASKAKAEYRRESAAFVEAEIKAGKTCPVVAMVPELRDGIKYGHPICNRLSETHHFYGRLGKLLLAKWGWIALSKQGHRFCHEQIVIARALGFIAPVGCWNNYEAAKADAIRRGWLTRSRRS